MLARVSAVAFMASPSRSPGSKHVLFATFASKPRLFQQPAVPCFFQWTAAGIGPRFCLYVHHDDAQREWAYDRESHIGRLDNGLDEAKDKNWTVVSMKDDWKTIYAEK